MPASSSHSMRRVVIAGMIGNGLEWYDFALYGYFVPVIGKLFFPAGGSGAHLVEVYGIFAAGFIMRPLGALLFGYIGDKFGRKSSLTLSILLMALPTGCIGLLPPYAQIGIWAPILLTVIRLFQGLSLAGQFSGSIAFITEHAPPERRGLAASMTILSLCVGMLLGSLVATLFSHLPQEAFESWGWRVPFLFGMVIALVGFYIRHNTDESPAYMRAKAEGALSETPIREVVGRHRLTLLRGIGIYLSVTVPFYILTVYMTGLLTKTVGLPARDVFLITTLSMLFLTCLVPLNGWLSDRFTRKRIMMAGTVLYFVSVYPIFLWLTTPGFANALWGDLALTLVVGSYIGAAPAVFVELFPTSVRYTGMALSYNICAALFGGTAPMVSAWLVEKTGQPASVACYIMLCAALSFLSFLGYRDTSHETLH